MVPYLHCFRYDIVINVRGTWGGILSCSILWVSPSLRVFLVQAKCTVSCAIRSGITFSPPLRVLSISPKMAYQFCPVCFTAVLLEPQDSRQHKLSSPGECFLLGVHFVWCRQARPAPHPTPVWAVSCLHLMEVLVGVIFSCWFWNNFYIPFLLSAHVRVYFTKLWLVVILPFPHQVTLWAQFPKRNNPPFWLKPCGAFPGVSLSVPPVSHLGAGSSILWL